MFCANSGKARAGSRSRTERKSFLMVLWLYDDFKRVFKSTFERVQEGCLIGSCLNLKLKSNCSIYRC